jgi:hypothetical protein
MELASVVYRCRRAIDAGEPIVKSTYTLEGNGPLVFKCYDQIKITQAR